MAKVEKCSKSDDESDKVKHYECQMDRSLLLFDALELESKSFYTACYCENDIRYVSSSELEIIVKRIIAFIECAERNGVYHRAIKEAKTYFKGAIPEIIAYKKQLEYQVTKHFGKISSLSVLDSICPIIECLDQVQRSYENVSRREIWSKKLATARASFRLPGYIDQSEIDNAINKVAEIMLALKKSNSLVESINSVIRRFLVTYKSIPSWFCSLFTFYWNHRTFSRGKRKGLKPREILTRKPFERDWIDIIIEKWPSKEDTPICKDIDSHEFKAAI